jgi:twitching motility protein PilT
MEIEELFRWMLDEEASDMHLKVGLPPALRVSGQIGRAESEALTAEEIWRWIQGIASPDVLHRLDKEREADFSYQLLHPDGRFAARFRCNVFHQMGKPGAVFRVIPQQIPTLADLAMPDILKTMTEREYGIVLVTGPTGSGKSTTLAAMLDHVNETQNKHILTIEDPVEFVHPDKASIINQREVGSDTLSFSEALRRALRQDPDIILVGEMRDAETITIAMTAAETGHLVFSTLHTNDAKQTIDRIINAFPPEEHHQVRAKLAVTLFGVVSQRLVKRVDGGGRVAVQEIMLNSPTIRKLIEEGRTGQMDKSIEESTDYYGMQSMNQHLLALWSEQIITEEDALAVSNNPGDLRLKMQTRRFSDQASAPKKGIESRYG